MAIKTLSVEVDAYERLVRARKHPKESFSSVLRRAVWLDEPATAANILDDLEKAVKSNPALLLDDANLDRIDRRKRTVRTKSAWAEGR